MYQANDDLRINGKNGCGPHLIASCTDSMKIMRITVNGYSGADKSLDREEAEKLYHYIGDFLERTKPTVESPKEKSGDKKCANDKCQHLKADHEYAGSHGGHEYCLIKDCHCGDFQEIFESFPRLIQ